MRTIRANKGDTLDYIAYRENVDLVSLVKLNSELTKKKYLDANETVVLPEGQADPRKRKKMSELFG